MSTLNPRSIALAAALSTAAAGGAAADGNGQYHVDASNAFKQDTSLHLDGRHVMQGHKYVTEGDACVVDKSRHSGKLIVTELQVQPNGQLRQEDDCSCSNDFDRVRNISQAADGFFDANGIAHNHDGRSVKIHDYKYHCEEPDGDNDGPNGHTGGVSDDPDPETPSVGL